MRAKEKTREAHEKPEPREDSEHFTRHGSAEARKAKRARARRARKASRERSAAKTTNRARHADAPALTRGSSAILEKHVRAALKMPRPPKNPFAALMQPMAIVPDDASEKPVLADAGSIVKLTDQVGLYRDRISPITRRADEILVHYGNAKTPKLGWLTQKFGAQAMRPSTGPTFLVTTKNDAAVNAWEQFRLRMARARLKDASMWLAPWLAMYGAKYPTELRAVVRFFGGKTFKSESALDRVQRLFVLILNTEFDMATLKKGKKSAKAKGKDTSGTKVSKKSKSKTSTKTREKPDASDRITTKHDEYVIRRLVKENPRRAGSEKAKIWDRLKKGMTVGVFVTKGGSRASVKRYIENGWIKLLKPASTSE